MLIGLKKEKEYIFVELHSVDRTQQEYFHRKEVITCHSTPTPILDGDYIHASMKPKVVTYMDEDARKSKVEYKNQKVSYTI